MGYEAHMILIALHSVHSVLSISIFFQLSYCFHCMRIRIDIDKNSRFRARNLRTSVFACKLIVFLKYVCMYNIELQSGIGYIARS